MPDPAQILRDAYDQVRRDYGGAIGQRREELVTPALVLDIDVAQRNIDHMASELKQMGAAVIRPHYKAHKNPDIARRQVAAGAAGLSMATVWEAVVLAAAGFDDLFVVNTVAHPGKLRALAELARDHRILVAVDEAANAEALSAAAAAAGSTLGIMIEVDTGMDRCGVDSAADCLALARQVTGLPGLRLEGITGYEGHCSLTRVATMAQRVWGGAWVLLLFALLNSAIALSIACFNGGTRTWYAMGRSGVLPRMVGKVNRVRQTPVNAITLQVGVQVIAFACVLIWGAANVFFSWANAITIGLVLMYLLCNIGVIKYYLTEGRAQFNPLLHLVVPVLASAAGILVVWKSYFNPFTSTGPVFWGLMTFIVVLALTVVILIYLKVAGKEDWMRRAQLVFEQTGGH